MIRMIVWSFLLAVTILVMAIRVWTELPPEEPPANRTILAMVTAAAPPPATTQAEGTIPESLPNLLAQAESSMAPTPVVPQKLYRGAPDRKAIAFTFDDGPHEQYTPRLLEVLKQHEVKATFFVVGTRIAAHPDLLRAIAADGHCIANHTYHHPNMTTISAEEMGRELDDCAEAVRALTGRAPRLFRPPGGQYNNKVTRVAVARGYTLVFWSAEARDYDNPGSDVIAARVLAKAGNGGIVLLHSGVQDTLDALPAIITALRDRGFQFVTVEELIDQMRAPQLSAR